LRGPPAPPQRLAPPLSPRVQSRSRFLRFRRMRGQFSPAVLSWSFDRGLVAANPCERGGRLYRSGGRAEKIWTATDEAALLERASAHLHLPLMLALWTGQRQGDLLRLPWSGYDGTHIRLRQRKTGARVLVRVGAPLKAALDAMPKRSTIILTNSEGKPWTSGWLPGVVGQGVQSGWRCRRDVSRLARDGGYAARACRMHRSRNRHDHRPFAAWRACYPRQPLPEPRSGARRKCNPQARKGNKSSQLTAQLVCDVLLQKRERPSENQWWAHKDSNLGPAD
jgi:integrase